MTTFSPSRRTGSSGVIRILEPIVPPADRSKTRSSRCTCSERTVSTRERSSSSSTERTRRWRATTRWLQITHPSLGESRRLQKLPEHVVEVRDPRFLDRIQHCAPKAARLHAAVHGLDVREVLFEKLALTAERVEAGKDLLLHRRLLAGREPAERPDVYDAAVV